MAGSLDSAEQNIVEALEVAAELAENLGARAQIGGDAKANEAATARIIFRLVISFLPRRFFRRGKL